MTFEDILRGILIENDALNELLAKYADCSAVFYQSAPDDTAKGWEQRKQYPRIDYAVDYISNPERKTSGVMTLNVYCTEDGTLPEEIEPIIRNLLCGTFITPDDAPPYSLSWARSDVFQAEKSDGIVIGVTMTFDVFSFPSQVTTDPDPVLAMNHYIEELIPIAEIIGGKKPTERVFAPSKDYPAFYFRLESIQTQRETNTVAWMDCVIACHIFAGGEEITWLKYLVDRLAIAGDVEMLDTSYMLLQNLKADSTMDALSMGQLRIYGRFGILRRELYAHPLINQNRTFRIGGD